MANLSEMPRLTRMDGQPAPTTSGVVTTPPTTNVSFSPGRAKANEPSANEDSRSRNQIPAPTLAQGGWGGPQVWGSQPNQGWGGQDWNNSSGWQGCWPQNWGYQQPWQQPGWQTGYNPQSWQGPIEGNQRWNGPMSVRGASLPVPPVHTVERASDSIQGQDLPLTPTATPPPSSTIEMGLERSDSGSEDDDSSDSDEEKEDKTLSFSNKVLKVREVLGLPVEEEREQLKLCSFDTTTTAVTPAFPPSEMFLQYCDDWQEKLKGANTKGKHKTVLKADSFPTGVKVRWEAYRITGDSWSGEALRAPDILDTPLFPHSARPYLKLSNDTCMSWETSSRNTLSCLNYSEYFIGGSRKMLEEGLRGISKPEVSADEIATLRSTVGLVQELLASAGRGIHDAVKTTIDRMGQTILIRRDAWQNKMASGIDLGIKEKLRSSPILGTKGLFPTTLLQEALDSSSKTESHKVNQVILTQHKRKPEVKGSKKPYDHKTSEKPASGFRNKRPERSGNSGGQRGRRSFRGKGKSTDNTKDKK